MFYKSARAIILSIVVSIGGVAATTASSQAGSSYIDFNISAPGIQFSSGRGYRENQRWNHGYKSNNRRRACAPRRALRKARRMGIRNAHIVRVNRRVLVVKGYRYGDRAKVKFGRSGHCPVISVRNFRY